MTDNLGISRRLIESYDPAKDKDPSPLDVKMVSGIVRDKSVVTMTRPRWVWVPLLIVRDREGGMVGVMRSSMLPTAPLDGIVSFVASQKPYDATISPSLEMVTYERIDMDRTVWANDKGEMWHGLCLRSDVPLETLKQIQGFR